MLLLPRNFDFDLGGTFSIESFALWNAGGRSTNNVIGFTLLADDNPSFSGPSNLGSFMANPNTGDIANVLPEVFSFAPTTSAFVRLQITSNNGGVRTVLGEGAFEIADDTTAIPEPSSVASGRC